jgi:hypothetical protein
MLLSAVWVLVVAQSRSEIPEGLMNNPVCGHPISTFLIRNFGAHILSHIIIIPSIPSGFVCLAAPSICRLFDILQSLVQYCKVQTYKKKILKKYRNIYEANSGIYIFFLEKRKNVIRYKN